MSLFQIYHPNIVQTHEIITINQKVFIALEWAGRGDLLGYVRLKGAIKEPEVRVSNFLADSQLLETKFQTLCKAARLFNEMCLALEYLHGKNIVHRYGFKFTRFMSHNLLISIY